MSSRSEAAGADPLGGEQETRIRDETSWWLDQAGILLVAVVLALLLRTFVIEPFRIPSESMLPTLQRGDHLFVNKFLYGAEVPLTGWRLPPAREPRRGDVVVFEVARLGSVVQPADVRPAWLRERFVKRIVGLPGDWVEVDRLGRLAINGAPVESWATGEVVLDAAGRPLEGRRALLAGREHAWLEDPEAELPPLAVRVPVDRYLLLGDNRDHSNDGRVFGTVHRREIEGPAVWIYWSWNWQGRWAQLLDPRVWWELLTERTRWGRIGDSIH